MKAFIAVELPESAKKEILRIQKEIEKIELIKGKFTEKENLHLTLRKSFFCTLPCFNSEKEKRFSRCSRTLR